MISESVLLVQGGMTSLQQRLESESSQEMSQDSIFGSREETWNGKIRTEAENLQVRCERKAGFQGVHPLAVVPLVVLDFGAGMCHPVGVIIEDLVFVPSIAVFETK